ncbi:MAG: ROK family protein [Sphaerochaetaceae bacterium]|nr:ROK family protein [Sphaerochaetaceae bacterium]
MEFSRPENARKLNRLRVLTALRENDDLTRASLATLLGLNKVSTGEIVSALIEEGFVEEIGKLEKKGGRPGTILKLKNDSAVVLGCDIKTRSCSVAIFDLLARPLRSEQFPLENIKTAEELRDQLVRVSAKMVKMLQKRVLGMIIATNSQIEGQKVVYTTQPLLEDADFEKLFDGCPFPVSLVSALEAEVEAERFQLNSSLEETLLINWGEHLTSALILKDRIVTNNYFGHMPLTRTGTCHCGGTGCLETLSSGYGLRKQTPEDLSVRDMMKEEEKYRPLIEKASLYLGKAIINALSATGARNVILTGGISNLPEYYQQLLVSLIEKEGGPSFSNVPIRFSDYREKGSLQGSGVLALDRFFFQRNLLVSLGFDLL